MKIQCPYCKQKYEVADDWLNQTAECTMCKMSFVISSPAPDDQEQNKTEFNSESKLSNKQNQNSIENTVVRQKNTQRFSSQKSIFAEYKMQIIFAIFVVLCFGVVFYNSNKNNKESKWIEEQNKKIISEALLDLAKYPGSSNVVIEYYNAFDNHPTADFISADGYIDMANAFGTKARYKFRFHIEKFTKRNRFFFSIYGGQKIIVSKEDLGMITLEDSDGKTDYYHAEKLWEGNRVKR